MNNGTLTILEYMILTCIDDGRVGIKMPLAHLYKNGMIGKASFYRAINQLICNDFIIKISTDSYMLSLWASELKYGKDL